MNQAQTIAREITNNPSEVLDTLDSHFHTGPILSEFLEEKRWAVRQQDVYQCDDGSLLAVELDHAATENTDIDDPNARAYEAEAVQVTITQFKMKEPPNK